MTIIPAIDIIDGKCVRLIKGDYSQKTIYNEDPLEVAKQFEDAGFKRLHLVDLDGARTGEVRNWRILQQIASKTSLVIDFSGGLSSEKSIRFALNSGAAYASVGSIVVKDPATFIRWLEIYGADKFIIGADVKNEKIVIRGWTETTDISVFELIDKYNKKGVKQFFCTDINKDGLLQGPATNLYKKILKKHPAIDCIASGGISSLKELEKLKKAGCSGAIIGKAIYENKISLKSLEQFV